MTTASATPKARGKGRKNLATERGTSRLSHTAENYLLSLSILQEDGIAPHISQLAAYLRHIPPEEEVGTTLASVSGMVQRMAKEGLLVVSKEKEIFLTEEGQRVARGVVRRHRLAERLLTDILGVPLERAEGEAHRLEHSISPWLLERIETKLGNPETCPYGRPIYRENEPAPRKEAVGTIRLSESKPGTAYLVTRIPDEDYPLLRFLVENKILPGQRIVIDDNAPYRGVVDLRRDNERVSLGMEVTHRVRVRPA
ncbi:MAG: metal-dependent transcriptional regulator [SAR202 cluster bacterium]|nr:metal-dependent transcriptional regulator [SAR202 cluster bacterium]